MRNVSLFIVALWGIGLGCGQAQTHPPLPPLGHAYPVQPIDIRNVQLTDAFWLPIIQRVQEQTIEYAIAKCAEEGRFDNFLLAGGYLSGTVKGQMPFDDTDPYKIIEGASNTLISAPNAALERQLDSLIAIIGKGQEADGYLTTWRTIDPARPPAPWVKVVEGKRWESLFMSHELYNAGHLYEAAYTHHKATGKRNFLDIALKNADLMVATFGDGPRQISGVPGHQIIETGLIKLYLLTGREDYLNLAQYFLDGRGQAKGRELFGPYSQDHLPVVAQTEVVGHAVRAMYMYAAMTDIAVLKADTAYRRAVLALWDNMVSKKMYLTGGIGARHDGEAFGDNYELPNLTAYNETCAAIGSVYWNHRLYAMTGQAQYYDILERTLYNGLIAGLSLDGTHFFYPNALEADGKYPFNRGACTRQGWFDCSCCPTNLIRFVPSIAGLLYATSAEAIYVNLYAANRATVPWQGSTIALEQATEYPWSGQVRMTVTPERATEATIRFRVPAWARVAPAPTRAEATSGGRRNGVSRTRGRRATEHPAAAVRLAGAHNHVPGGLYHYLNTTVETPKLLINGQPWAGTVQDGYYTVARTWQPGDVVTLQLPMQVRLVAAVDAVADTRGKAALEYGPLVYAIEEADNPGDFDALRLRLNDPFRATHEAGLLGGVTTLDNGQMKAVPYYAWSNRGVGKMKVWIPLEGL